MITKTGTRQCLHYGCVLITFFYVTVSILIGFRRAKRAARENSHYSRPKSYILLSSLLVMFYIIQGTIVAITAIDSLYSLQSCIIYTFSLGLVWSVVAARRTSPVFEILAVSSITTLFEIPPLAHFPFRIVDQGEWKIELVCQLCRILLLIYLLAGILHTWFQKSQVGPKEAQPILHNGNGLLKTEKDKNVDSDLCDQSDTNFEYGGSIKKRRAKRLQETGSWWIYLQEFSALLPYLIPKKDRKVQICIMVSLLCLIGNRVLHVMLPLQIGVVTDNLLNREAPYGALGVWFLLKLSSGLCGLGLIEDLAKIPIRQFSYRQITNAAFGHVMNLSMDFHLDRDSAEVMRAIEQGGALTNLLDTVVVDIVPTFVDLLIAFVFLYWKFNAYASLAMVVASIAYISVEAFASCSNIPNRRRLTKTRRKESRVMHQAVEGWQMVSYFNRFTYERCRFGEAVERYLTASKKYSQRSAYIRAIVELLVPVTFLSLACMVIYEVGRGKASSGDFVFFLQYWDTLMYPLKQLSRQYRYLMWDLVDAERLLLLLQSKPSVADKEGAMDLDTVKGYVVFKNVSFSYDLRHRLSKN